MFNKTKIICLIFICGLMSLVQGSCLEYGHSCWGAHGKRSAKPSSPVAEGIENIKFKKSVSDTSMTQKSHRYILLNILLDKNDLENLEEISDVSNFQPNAGNEIDVPKIRSRWNKNKFKTPLQKRNLLFQSSLNSQGYPTKVNNSEEDEFKYNPYSFFLKPKYIRPNIAFDKQMDESFNSNEVEKSLTKNLENEDYEGN